MSDTPKTLVHGVVRVMVTLDVEVSWADDRSGMAKAAELACERAASAVSDAMGQMADVTGDGVRLAKGPGPTADCRRVSANLEIM